MKLIEYKKPPFRIINSLINDYYFTESLKEELFIDFWNSCYKVSGYNDDFNSVKYETVTNDTLFTIYKSNSKIQVNDKIIWQLFKVKFNMLDNDIEEFISTILYRNFNLKLKVESDDFYYKLTHEEIERIYKQFENTDI